MFFGRTLQTVMRKKQALQEYADDVGQSELCQVFLLVGQGGLYSRPTLVQTVLGSCVSVTMYAPKVRWGGMFHALLPKAEDFSGKRTTGDDFRYVDSAIRQLLNEFAAAGIAPASLECKVFGGASPLHQCCDGSAGSRNIAAAMQVLADLGIPIAASSVGGNEGRKLIFRTDTGLVLQKRFLVSSCNQISC